MASSLQELPWKRFSQSEDLTVRLRNILHDYAFGPGVFRELLQNADDAGAQRFAILADETSYSVDGLLDPRLGGWQGPAVCAFNDAEFTDADFDGICRVGASGKRTDHAKIGRYGLGFNATYHLSDVVAFASRDRLCIFDPHEAHLPGDLPGLQLRLPAETRQLYAAQLAPFEAAAEAFRAEVWPLQGALFRLPLRTPELAARSQICHESHDFHEVLGVLEELLRGAQELLLFLQSVESLEVLVRPSGSTQARRLGCASLRTASEETAARLRSERRLLSGLEASLHSDTKRTSRRACYTFLLDVERCTADAKDTVVESFAWMVMARGEPSAAALSSKDGDDELPRFQCGAVAIRLWPVSSETAPVVGQAFCFLPLALPTGLSVHISANFALTANRRDLWRRSDDKASSHGTRRAAWNEALLHGTLPRTYADALECLAAGIPALSCESSADTHVEAPSAACRACNFMPEQGPWAQTLRGAFPPSEFWECWPAPSANHGQGIFEPLARHTTAELFNRDAAVLWDEAAKCYTGAKSALLCSANDSARFDEGFRSALRRLRESGCRRSIVEIPERMRDTLSEAKGVVWLRPQSLANAIRSSSPRLEVQEADAVVAYLLSGGNGPLTVLHGLTLAPLVGGGLGRFEKPGLPGVAYLWWSQEAKFCELLPDRIFIDPSSATFKLLQPRVANAPLNIRLLNAKALPLVLPAVVPPAWRGRRAVSVVSDAVYVDGEPSEAVQKTADARAGMVRSNGKSPNSTQRGSQGAATRAARSSTNKAAKGNKRKEKMSVKNGRHLAWDDEQDEGLDYVEEYEEEQKEDEDWHHQDGSDDEECQYMTGQYRSQGGQRKQAVAAELEPEAGCICSCVEDLERIVRRCQLLWSLIERAQVKGTNPEQVVADIPCVPIAQPTEGVPHTIRLLSLHEAMKRHALSVEDFSSSDRSVLELCGVPFLRPEKRLRTALGIEKSSTLAALQVVFADRWSRAPDDEVASANPRLFIGLRPLRLALEEARPLRTLIRHLIRRNLVPHDSRSLEALPIFETQGARYAVPLSPSSARIMSPSEDWDEALCPQFADYLISWADEAGELLSEIGHERASGAPRFLAEFAAPRAGLFDQPICVKFLEAVASLGAAPWKKPGAPKDLAAVAQACIDAPLVVFPPSDSAPGRRLKCSHLTDPGDSLHGTLSLGLAPTCFPPEAYCSPLVLSVMRKAGLSSLTDDTAFLSIAKTAECSSGAAEAGAALFRYLGERWESLKWPSKAYAALGKLRIFPSLGSDTLGAAYPPVGSSLGPSPRIPVALDGMCTVFHNADIAWTQYTLLDPEVFNRWPAALLRRFGALKDPVPVETVTANLAEVASRWAKEPEAEAARSTCRRQAIVATHLDFLNRLSKQRSHATQIMVQQQLCRLAFLAMDDGSLSKPCDVFVQLHSGGDSDGEDEKADDVPTKAQHARDRPSKNGGQWSLPAYLRPFRRLLLSVAGPAVSAAAKKAPSVHVGCAPDSESVPKFLQTSLNQPELADVEFLLCDESKVVSVYAHRLILAAACEHFRAMFTSGCAEAVGVNGRCVIELPEWVSPRPLLWMLAYLYQGFDPHAAQLAAARLALHLDAGRGGMPISSSPIVGTKSERRRLLPKLVDEAAVGEELCCLLRLSDMYGLNHLMQWTESRLQALLNPENLIAISTHAYFCNGAQLLKVCVYHMQLLYGDIAKTAEWESLEPAIRDLVLLDNSDGIHVKTANSDSQ